MASRSSAQAWRYDLLLLLVIFSLFPVTTFVVFLTTISSSLPNLPTLRNKQVQKHATPRRKILITGANNPLALTLARVLHAEGHVILAADYEATPLVSPARASKAVAKFYRLGASTILPISHVQKGNTGTSITRFGSITHELASLVKGASEAQLYARDLEAIARHADGVDLWIPCDQDTPATALAAAREVMIKLGGGAIYPDPKLADLEHDDDAFADWVGALDTFVKPPERKVVKSRGEIHRILHHSPKGRQYLLDRAGLFTDSAKQLLNGNATNRDSSTALSLKSTPSSCSNVSDSSGSLKSAILPLATINETYHALAALPISAASPWILHELPGHSYTDVSTHCLIVASTVRTFLATSSISSGGPPRPPPSHSTRLSTSILSRSCHTTLPSMSALHASLLAFTKAFAAKFPAETSTHLSLTFQLVETATKTGVETVVVPKGVAMMPCAELALLAVDEQQSEMMAEIHTELELEVPERRRKRIVEAYVEAVEAKNAEMLTNGTSAHECSVVKFPPSVKPGIVSLYSLPHLIAELLVLPVWNLLLSPTSIKEVVASGAKFGEWIVYGTEELWAWEDAGVWWWQWYVQFPVDLVGKAIGGLVARRGW